jgi:23S rRNA (uracil1939-C5)-methyltransferase
VTEAVLNVERIGARGDGIARHEGRAVYLPLTAPGDVVRASFGRDGHATKIEMLTPGRRQAAPCPHFGICGGCALQHLAEEAYRQEKAALVSEALARQGLMEVEIAPMRFLAPATRRRAQLAIARRGGRVEVGFRERGSHRVADLQTCLVLHPALVALIEPLRALGDVLCTPRDTATAAMNLAERGIDLLLDLPRAPDRAALEAMARFAAANDLARLSWRVGRDAPTPVVQRHQVELTFGEVAVALPPDCFLQASAESEAVLRELVLGGIGDGKTIADLYAGIGTFSFPLARQAKVHAVDGDGTAIAALQAAARRAGLETRITAEIRDLASVPLRADELARFDAVLFDPPYAGANEQARELARSTVPRVVAVSCHPASFARDARILVDGGYRLARVMPVDQFVWSAEIELVAWFER